MLEFPGFTIFPGEAVSGKALPEWNAIFGG
jgi:hypothetical protein